MRKMLLGIAATGLLLLPGAKAMADLQVDDFETDTPKWAVPDWALEKADHVAKKVELSEEFASKGKKSLKINAAFPGGNWTAAVVELEDYLDFTGHKKVAFDVYLPADAPIGLKGNIVLTVGDGWVWTEQLRPVPLEPGKWTTVEASIENGSKDWKKTVVDDAFRGDVRKIDLRIISDKKPAYTGAVFIDNIRAVGDGATAK